MAEEAVTLSRNPRSERWAHIKPGESIPADHTVVETFVPQEWRERCKRLTDPNPGGWAEALREARAALAEGDDG